MSGQTSVYIKLKELNSEPKNYICIFQLGSTPSRELDVLTCTTNYSFGSGNLSLETKDGIQPLTDDKIADIFDFYKENIAECKRQIAEDKNKLLELNNQILKISSKEIYKCIKEDSSSLEDSIRWNEECIEDNQRQLDKFLYAMDMLENNATYTNGTYISDYELFYSKD